MLPGGWQTVEMETLPAFLVEQCESDRAMIEQGLRQYTELDAGCPERLREAIRYALLAPGKRLRPLLVLAAARCCGGDPLQALPVACAVEMIHAYSLVHDDLPAMDDDDLRRGRPTVHVQYDEATAILVGDALIPLAFETISRHVHPPGRALGCVRELAIAAGACNLVGGQADDLRAETEPPADPLQRVEEIHLRKTAALLAVSLRLGGVVAGAAPAQCESLEKYGRHLGLAFQITDDLLDFSGDPTTMGKRAAKDGARGKLTYPALLGVEASRELARFNTEQAIAALDSLGIPAGGLVALARSVAGRNS